jgi:hypothetical protein
MQQVEAESSKKQVDNQRQKPSIFVALDRNLEIKEPPWVIEPHP